MLRLLKSIFIRVWVTLHELEQTSEIVEDKRAWVGAKNWT